MTVCVSKEDSHFGPFTVHGWTRIGSAELGSGAAPAWLVRDIYVDEQTSLNKHDTCTVKVLSLLLLILELGCASNGANRQLMSVDREHFAPPDVQPAPLAAGIPGALAPPTTAQAPPPRPYPGPILKHFKRGMNANPVFNGEILPSRIDRVTLFGCEDLNFWTFTNLDEGTIYGLEVSLDGGKTWRHTRDWTGCAAPNGADGRLTLYLPGTASPRPRLIPIETNLSSWFKLPESQP